MEEFKPEELYENIKKIGFIRKQRKARVLIRWGKDLERMPEGVKRGLTMCVAISRFCKGVKGPVKFYPALGKKLSAKSVCHIGVSKILKKYGENPGFSPQDAVEIGAGTRQP